MSEQTIELDCPPGAPRPGDLIEAVIEGTGLPLRKPRSTVFGNWTWDYGDIPPLLWRDIQTTTSERIRDLYRQGTIRYGSW
jgi:hypothetical protein